jgi:predicted Rossmann fold nucleotide-binding protein DprA/Smf involved in DNA uptake
MKQQFDRKDRPRLQCASCEAFPVQLTLASQQHASIDYRAMGSFQPLKPGRQNSAAMKTFEILTLTPAQTCWPRNLVERLEAAAPSRLWTIGNPEILAGRKIGLFCSVECPGDTLRAAATAVRALRDQGAVAVSGFHSPVEKTCLGILLGDNVPSIIGLARSLQKIRIPGAWRRPLQEGRLLLISAFDHVPRNPTRKSSRQRNEIVAALSDEIFIIHAEPGGNIDRLGRIIERWRVPSRRLSVD